MSKPAVATRMSSYWRRSLVVAMCSGLAWLGACSSSSDPGGTGGAATGGAASGGTSATGGAATGGVASTGGSSTGGVATTGGVTTGGRAGAQGGSSGGAAGASGGKGGASSGGGAAAIGGGAAGGVAGASSGGAAGGSSGAMTLTSSAYAEGQTIPSVYTCAGADSSPPLAWTGAPMGTKSFTLVLLDATNNFVHWVLWDIPAATNALPAMIDETSAMPSNVAGARQLSGQGTGFLGPCPSGGLHTYRFTLYALPTEKLTLAGNATTMQVQSAAMQQALGTATLSGTSNAKKP